MQSIHLGFSEKKSEKHCTLSFSFLALNLLGKLTLFLLLVSLQLSNDKEQKTKLLCVSG